MLASARVRIQQADFDLSAEVAALHRGALQVGAVCSFVGTVRAWDGAQTAAADAPAGTPAATAITRLELEHYPGMTERAIEAMIDAAHARFDILDARVLHRVGALEPGAQIVLVAVSATHRHAAFAACEFLMDYLKTQAPFWKKEHGAHGARWVDARVSDDAALARWGLESGNAAGAA